MGFKYSFIVLINYIYSIIRYGVQTGSTEILIQLILEAKGFTIKAVYKVLLFRNIYSIDLFKYYYSKLFYN